MTTPRTMPGRQRAPRNEREAHMALRQHYKPYPPRRQAIRWGLCTALGLGAFFGSVWLSSIFKGPWFQ